ncbi:MAG: hypothetical protein OJF61_001575 [Rhodanobacteraceae bacterium]|jgi:hypothetical protein|nr:MAG: hypothetical protein OJF61_001575 [Rhodanobacteraceae bacterium]
MGKIIVGIVLLIPFFFAPVGILRVIAAPIALVGIILIVMGFLPRRTDTGSEYKKTTVGNDTKFDVAPARVPFPIGGAIFMGTICGIAAVLFFVNGPAIVGFFILIFAVGLILLFWKGGPASKYRQPASFLVGSDSIVINGNRLPANDIHRLILRNHVDGSQIAGPSVQGPVVAYNAGTLTGAVGASAHAMVAATAATGEILAQRRRMKIQRIAYRLDAEAGGKAVTLACGMDETTAYGLMTDVANILGMR